MGDGQQQGCRVRSSPRGEPNVLQPWAPLGKLLFICCQWPILPCLHRKKRKATYSFGGNTGGYNHTFVQASAHPVYKASTCKEAGQEADICAAHDACAIQFDVLTNSLTYHAASNDAAKPQRSNDKRCSIHFASHMGVLRHQDDSCHIED